MADKEKKEKAAKEKPKADKKPKAEGKPAKPELTEAASFQHRVRVAGVVLDGSLPLERALTEIKGVGPRIANIVGHNFAVSEKKRIGDLSEQEIDELEKVLDSLASVVPPWMLNRRKDPESGKNRHLLGPDLDMQLREDINLMRRLKTYKGVRHSLNLPVRGQRTRTSFRKGATLGVSRRKK